MSPKAITRRTALAGLLLTLSAPAWAQTRRVATDFGDVDVPEAPLRIVTTHYGATQPLLDLGLVPVGQGQTPSPSNVPPRHWPLIENVPVVGLQGSELNYEAILMLAPDLIIEVNSFGTDRLARLEAIAPTVMVGTHGPLRGQWQHRAARIAEAVGRTAENNALAEAFAARQKAIATRFEDMLARHTIAIWSAWEAGAPHINPSNSMIGRVLAPTGARFSLGSEALTNEAGEEIRIGNEQLGAVLGDADIILFGTDLALVANPVTEQTRALANYRLLPSVAAGAEFPIGKLTIGGYGDAMIVLDHFETALTALQKLT